MKEEFTSTHFRKVELFIHKEDDKHHIASPSGVEWQK